MNKRAFILLVCFAVTSLGYAQLQTTVNANNNNLGALATYGPDGANIGATSLVLNPTIPIEGSVYLFDTWRNNGVFLTNKDKQLLIRNLNFNIDLGTFESQIAKDTIFTFTFDNIKRVFVNSREFKAIFKPSTGLYTVYEVIYEGEDFAILKKYRITIKKGAENNPMVNRKTKFITMDEYFLEQGEQLSKFRLKKKTVLKLSGDRASEMQAYAKENKLSFKNELDVNRMLTYFLD